MSGLYTPLQFIHFAVKCDFIVYACCNLYRIDGGGKTMGL
uniref:Uncharacterized protein n=1 Tax=Anguilla anguilla TaxID=7936 RepID=A0A0E9VXU2_ANGAN